MRALCGDITAEHPRVPSAPRPLTQRLLGPLQPASRSRSGGSGAARGACEARGDKAPRRRPHPRMTSQYRTPWSRGAGRFRGSVRVLRHALPPQPGRGASSADPRSADPRPPRPDRVSDVMLMSQEVLHPNTAPDTCHVTTRILNLLDTAAVGSFGPGSVEITVFSLRAGQVTLTCVLCSVCVASLYLLCKTLRWR